jgi:DNA primase
VSIEQILEYYGLEENLIRKGDQLIGPCPIHKGTNKSQFHVSLAKNAFRCFGDCASDPRLNSGGGNALSFVIVMEDIHEANDLNQYKAARKAALLLQEWFGLTSERTPSARQHTAVREAPALVSASPHQPPQPVAAEPEAPPVNRPLKFESLKNLDHTHPYLTKRGFTQATLEYFGVGLHSGRGIMAGRIAIPIANAEGQIVAYVGRWPGSEPPEGEGKYKLPLGFHKSLEIFNLHRAKICAREHGLVIVEGYFDVMRLYQFGVCHAVAIMGSTLSEAQEQLIIDAVGPQGRVTLCFDGDQSGQSCTQDVLQRLSQRLFVRAVRLGENIQPDDLQEDEVKALFD